MNINNELITKNTLYEYCSNLTLVTLSVHCGAAPLNRGPKWVWFIGITFNYSYLPCQPFIQLDWQWVPFQNKISIRVCVVRVIICAQLFCIKYYHKMHSRGWKLILLVYLSNRYIWLHSIRCWVGWLFCLVELICERLFKQKKLRSTFWYHLFFVGYILLVEWNSLITNTRISGKEEFLLNSRSKLVCVGDTIYIC